MNVLRLEYFIGYDDPGFWQEIAPDEGFDLQRDVVRDKLFGTWTPFLRSVSSKPVFSIKNYEYEQRQTGLYYSEMYVQSSQGSDSKHMSEVGMKIQLDHDAIISLYHSGTLVWKLRFEKNSTE